MAELGKKYCVYCLAEVSPLRFRCTECQDIELCPECFSAGAEIGHHRRYHGYQLVDGGRFTLWGPEAEGGWTSREEQLLLDAIEQFGFGNWVSGGLCAPAGGRCSPQTRRREAKPHAQGHTAGSGRAGWGPRWLPPGQVTSWVSAEGALRAGRGQACRPAAVGPRRRELVLPGQGGGEGRAGFSRAPRPLPPPRVRAPCPRGPARFVACVPCPGLACPRSTQDVV